MAHWHQIYVRQWRLPFDFVSYRSVSLDENQDNKNTFRLHLHAGTTREGVWPLPYWCPVSLDSHCPPYTETIPLRPFTCQQNRPSFRWLYTTPLTPSAVRFSFSFPHKHDASPWSRQENGTSILASTPLKSHGLSFHFPPWSFKRLTSLPPVWFSCTSTREGTLLILFCMDSTRGGIPTPPQERVPYSTFSVWTVRGVVFLHLHKRQYPTHPFYWLYTGWYSCTPTRDSTLLILFIECTPGGIPAPPKESTLLNLFLYGLYTGWYSCTSTRDSTLLILFIDCTPDGIPVPPPEWVSYSSFSSMDCTRGGILAPPQERVTYSSFSVLTVHGVVFSQPHKRQYQLILFCIDCTRGGIPVPPKERVPNSYSFFFFFADCNTRGQSCLAELTAHSGPSLAGKFIGLLWWYKTPVALS